MAQGRSQKFFFTGFWHFLEFRLYFLQQFNNDVLKHSWDCFCFKHLGECSCQKTSSCHMFPHQLEARDIALKAVHGLGSLKGTQGQAFAWSLQFLCKNFSAIRFACFLLSASVCYCNLFFFFMVAFVLRRECIFKMKLNKVSYKRSHLFSILRHFLFLLLNLFSFTLPFWLLYCFWRIDNHCKEKNVLFTQCP